MSKFYPSAWANKTSSCAYNQGPCFIIKSELEAKLLAGWVIGSRGTWRQEGWGGGGVPEEVCGCKGVGDDLGH